MRRLTCPRGRCPAQHVAKATANDLDPKAGEAIRRNAAFNDVPEGKLQVEVGDASSLLYAHRAPADRFHVVDLDPYISKPPPRPLLCRRQLLAALAVPVLPPALAPSPPVLSLWCSLTCVHGSAAPFLDAAVQSVANHGMLMVTCTDTATLSGPNQDVRAL